jgi:hypothetical protein
VNNRGTVISRLSNLAVDLDANALGGVAITSAATTYGEWQYSLDNGGHWNTLSDSSPTAARLLPENSQTLIRFVPKKDWNGSTVIYFRVWDQTEGSPGGTISLIGNQGSDKCLSLQYARAKIDVKPAAEPPEIGSLDSPIEYHHDDAPIVVAPLGTVTDADSTAMWELSARFNAGASNTNWLKIGEGFTVDSSTNVCYGNTLIGHRTSDGKGYNPLAIYFNAAGTVDVVQKLLRSITFETVIGSAGSRKLSFLVRDAPQHLYSDSGNVIINVS